MAQLCAHQSEVVLYRVAVFEFLNDASHFSSSHLITLYVHTSVIVCK